MIGTYAAALAVCLASLSIGQAAISLCGVRRWSWLSPPVGLALVCAVCWATVRVPGDGVVPAILVPLLSLGSVAYLWGRLEGGGRALRIGVPVALGALIAASLPFVAEGHFGILGTGFNPDMSQHLLATDRLAAGQEGELLRQGYPLGPHAVVVALNKGLGSGLVPGFTGLTIAVAILAPLTALTAFADRSRVWAVPAALLVGLPYLVASYFAQGAFKETIQALLVLAFVLALRESTKIAWRSLPLRYVPAAIIAIGAVYTYSFPGLIWLVGIGLAWVATESVFKRLSAGGVGVGGVEDGPWPARSAPPSPATGPAARWSVPWRPALLAGLVFMVGALPELSRMIDFKQFETFDPNGPGLGNLFGQVSPFTALGIWPSGDFRLAPGDGAVPAFAYYLGAAFATTLLLIGLTRAWRGRESAILAGVAAVALIYLAARIGGTAYTAAKALEVAAPVLTLAIVLSLSWRGVSSAGGAGVGGVEDRLLPARSAPPSPATGPAAAALVLYLLAAGACSLLAFANAPVGPSSYSSALTGLRPLLGTSPTLVLADAELLVDRHGDRYIAWELRGGRICIAAAGSQGAAPPSGVRFVITEDGAARPPFDQLDLRRRAGPFVVWERRGVRGGPSPCPLIEVRQARQGP